MGETERASEGKRESERGRPEKYDAGDGVSHCKVFQATAAKDDRKDDREEDTDARRKTKGEQARERKGVSVDGRLLRPCSRSFPLNSSANGGERERERETHTR